MRDRRPGMGFARGIIASAVLTSAASALGSTAPPHEYYVLSPEPLTGTLSVMSLESNNTITFGGYQLTLQQYERATVPATAFTSGTKFSGTGFFTLDSAQNAADLLVPDDFAGTSFVVPHIAGSHRYFFLSSTGTAHVTIRVGSSVVQLTANEGVVNEFDAGTNNAVAGVITSDVPIVLTHVAYDSGTARDAYPVPPATAELTGVRSQNTLIAALGDGTSVTVYASNGSNETITLDAGEQVSVSVGGSTAQGQGNAIRVVANAPIAAVQYGDGDGTDATAFWSGNNFGRRHGLPVDAQYLAIACDQASVNLTLYRGTQAPQTTTCSGSSTTPGKAYFGASTSGANLSAGWYVISSSPVYAMYEASTPEDEHNLLGLTPVAGPSEPVLNAVSTPTTSNPQSISGTAGANQLLRVYVNGLLQGTTTANASGTYTFAAALLDGTNTLYTTAVVAGNESDPSNAVSVEYNNTIARNQSGTLTGSFVWTAGSPAAPYTITAADLTIAAGSRLVLQAGTQLRFGNGRRLIVNGTLVVNGTELSNVVFTSDLASPTRGSWVGIVVNSAATDVSIDNATVEWAQTGISVTTAQATLRGNTVRNFSSNGIYLSGSTASSLVQSNTLDNLNDQGTCLYLYDASPNVIGNTLRNCYYGLYTYRNGSPMVNGNNLVTSNQYGVVVDGASAFTPQPIVTGNQLLGNVQIDYSAGGFVSNAQNVRLNATGNWWGTTNATAISAKITDLTDSYTATSLPTVDYSGFLDAPGGSAMAGNYLIGAFPDPSTTLTAGTTYDVLGSLFVRSGRSLTIPDGVTLRFHGAQSRLIVEGALTVQGTSGNMVTLTSGRPTPAKGDWQGVLIRAGASTTLIEHALIEWTTRAMDVATGVVATIRNNTIRNFTDSGVYMTGSTSSTIVQSNLIDNLNDQGTCLYLYDASPNVIGNTLRNCYYGLFAYRASSPVVNGNNVVTSNQYGVVVDGANAFTPQPIVSGNQLLGNVQIDYSAGGFVSNAQNVRLNATGNWWGTTVPTSISARIYDLTDSYTATSLPTVDYSGFLDAPGGSAVPGNYLIGPFPEPSTTLTAGTTYDVLGSLFVRSGRSLTIPDGAVLRFHGAQSRLIVEGSLAIQGTSGTPVTLTSGRPTPAKGDWLGVLIRAGASTPLIEHALIEWTTRGIDVPSGVVATIRNNTIRNFTDSGVYMTGATASTVVQSNTIDNINDQGTCLYLYDASPNVIGNTLRNCYYGSFAYRTSSPVVNGNNVVTSNQYGVVVDGANAFTPQPIVSGNQLLGNVQIDYSAGGFVSNAQSVRLNATGNWWGTTNAAAISAKIYDLTDSYTATSLPNVDYSGFLEAPGGSAVPGNYLIGPFPDPSTTLTAGTTYDVLGSLFVRSGRSLTIPGGVTLRFHGAQSRLIIEGSLTIQGTSGNMVTLTSGRPSPAKGDWPGVLIRAGASTPLIEHALIEWTIRGIDVPSSVVATIRNNTIRNFTDSGVYFTGATASTIVQSNTIDNINDQGTCLYLYDASPSVIGNTLRNCYIGLNSYRNSSPVVNSNNIITSNQYGMVVDGANAFTPQPIVTGNQLMGNTQYDYSTGGFVSNAQNVRLIATGNWWGTAVATSISAKIYDLTDSYTATSLPTVDYSGFLDAPGGSAVPGDYLIGPFPDPSATLTAGTTYDVLGSLFIRSGRSLMIPAGVVLRFHGAQSRLIVEGSLTIEGTSSNPVTLTSARSTPARGDWLGVLIRPGASTPLIEHALIEWATRGIDVPNGVVATIRNNTIRNFSDSGVYLTGATASTVVQSNIIDNLNDQGTCLYLYDASPNVIGNTLRNCYIGLFAYRTSSPVVNGNNIMTSNLYGMAVDGANTFTPQPVVTGNQLMGNTQYDYSTGAFVSNAQNVRLNATGNWWGTTVPTSISAKVYDLTDSYTATSLPTVDYSSFLDAPGGSVVPGNYLIGAFPDPSTTLVADTTYDVLGSLFVRSGRSLTIPAGVTLRFHAAQSRLLVEGALTVQGTDASRVVLTSGLVDPVKGAWYGIEIRATASASLIDYAVIDWSVRAISVTTATATIRNSIIRNFTDTGIWMSGVSSASQITNNYIDNFDQTGTGIFLSASSPAITGNQIHRTYNGIHATGASSPAITGNAITNNVRGIYLDGGGSNSASAVPNPVITGNDVFGNTYVQLELYNYGASNPVVINATDNWWGTATPVIGQHIRLSSAPASTLNATNPSSTPRTRPVSGNVVLSQYYFSPNGDSQKDTTAITGTLNQAANWTVNVRNGAYGIVRNYSGSGTSISAIWDGRNAGGQVLADGIYTMEVAATGTAGTAIVGTRSVTLDNTPPVTIISSPQPSAIINNAVQVPVDGSASDTYLVNFTLQYGAGATPSSWITLNSQNTNGISNALLGTWTVSSVNGTVGLANGPYQLRLSTSDRAGNVGLVQVPVTLDLLSITAVTQNLQLMKPLAGQQLQVNFTLSNPATATLRVYPEAGGPLVKETTQVFSSGGQKTMTWDGRTALGAYVPDNGYNFVIVADDGSRTATYDPPRPAGEGSGSGTVDMTFNANRNDFWKMDYQMGHFGRIRMQVTGCGLTTTHYPYNWVPYPPGTHPLIWDGRGAGGELVSGSCSIYFDPPQFMKPASVIVRGAVPVITGTGTSPNIEVKSNPYRIAHSYEQVSKITYRLDQDSYVTVKLLPPGITDPASPQAVVLTNTQLQAAMSGGQPLDHTVEWKGYDELDTNDILVSDEGTYTFAIQATSVASGATALYRGGLQLWQ